MRADFRRVFVGGRGGGGVGVAVGHTLQGGGWGVEGGGCFHRRVTALPVEQ